MGTSDLFRRFDARISVDESEGEDALGRALGCHSALRAHYFPTSTQQHLTLLGSIPRSTGITPVADIDIVFHLPAGTHAKFDAYAGNGQSALLQEVRGILRNRYPRTDIRGDGPVVVVAFTTGPNVEIVPGVLFVHGDPDILHANCSVPVTRDGGSWERVDYGAAFDKFLALNNRKAGQYARLIRYLKTWRRVQNAAFKSLLIELMGADFMISWDPEHKKTSYVYDDWLVRDFLSYAVNHYYSTYSIPGTGKRLGTGVGWLNAAERSHADAVTACLWGDTNPRYGTSWRKVLGSDFGA